MLGKKWLLFFSQHLGPFQRLCWRIHGQLMQSNFMYAKIVVYDVLEVELFCIRTPLSNYSTNKALFGWFWSKNFRTSPSQSQFPICSFRWCRWNFQKFSLGNNSEWNLCFDNWFCRMRNILNYTANTQKTKIETFLLHLQSVLIDCRQFWSNLHTWNITVSTEKVLSLSFSHQNKKNCTDASDCWWTNLNVC